MIRPPPGQIGPDQVGEVILRATARLEMLKAVAALHLPDCWLAAGAIRNAVWDHLHAYPDSTPLADADVIWFDRTCSDASLDMTLERRLSDFMPSVNWSVKNQARMHVRNDDPPYESSLHAMRYWTETATSVAARLRPEGNIEIAAAFGLGDLAHGIVQPTPWARQRRMEAYRQRVARKNWSAIWPLLTFSEAESGGGVANSFRDTGALGA